MFVTSGLHADIQPKFTIVPIVSHGNQVKVTKVGSAGVIYRVTNKTKITRTLTISPIKGVIQKTGGAGSCSKFFTLGPNQSCLLALEIQGRQIPKEGYIGGPVVCKSHPDGTPDPFLCSQPSVSNSLYVTFIQLAYITNSTTNTVSKCTLAANGTFSSCVDSGVGSHFNAPGEIAIHPSLPIAYVVNSGSDSVSHCTVGNEGRFVTCTDFSGGSFPFNNPEGITLNGAGTIAYVPNTGSNTVSQCLINSNGTFNNCTEAGTMPSTSAPFGVALNASGTLAYVTCCEAVIKCFIQSNGSFGVCVDSGAGEQFSVADGITLNKSNSIAYVVNQGAPDDGISVCQVVRGNFLGCRLFSLPPGFDNPTDIVLNRAETLAYISTMSSTVAVCTIKSDGNLGSCMDSGWIFGQSLGITLSE